MSGNQEFFNARALARRLVSGDLPWRSVAVAVGKTVALFAYTARFYYFRVRKLDSAAGRADPMRGLRLMTEWCGTILGRMNVDVEVKGTPPRQPDPGADAGEKRGLLLVCNHRSYLDVPSVGSQMSTYMVGAAFARSWPVLGPGGSLVGILYVDRTSPDSRRSTAELVKDRLNAGYSVLNFPEGASFSGEGMAPFKTGLFRMVAGAAVDLVPVLLRYSPGVAWVGENQAEMADGRAAASQKRPSMIEHLIGLLSGPTITTKIEFLEALRCEDHADADALMALVRKQMLDSLAGAPA